MSWKGLKSSDAQDSLCCPRWPPVSDTIVPTLGAVKSTILPLGAIFKQGYMSCLGGEHGTKVTFSISFPVVGSCLPTGYVTLPLQCSQRARTDRRSHPSPSRVSARL